jgi:hypothetical protein
MVTRSEMVYFTVHIMLSKFEQISLFLKTFRNYCSNLWITLFMESY